MRHGCDDCGACDGTSTAPCSWARNNSEGPVTAHFGDACPGRSCGEAWRGCHHCGAPTPCPAPCWYDERDADGNPLMFTAAEVAA